MSQQKDRAEKNLFGINKLFANIGNFAVFRGKEVLNETNLQDDAANYPVKEGKKFIEYTRDIVKIASNGQTKIAILAIENQTAIDQTMLFRVMHYDSLLYLKQMENGAKPGKILPVKTVVLYFGKKPWSGKTTMRKMVALPENMKGMIPNYFIKVVDFGALTARQKSQLHPDLQVLADVIQALRRHKKLVASTVPFEFPEKTLDVISLVTGDNKIKMKYNELVAQRKGQICMCEIYKQWLDEGIQKGLNKGLKQGIQQGIQQGRVEGKAEGALAKALETARKMLSKHFSIDDIIDLTGLSLEQVQALAAQTV